MWQHVKITDEVSKLGQLFAICDLSYTQKIDCVLVRDCSPATDWTDNPKWMIDGGKRRIDSIYIYKCKQ